MENHTPQPSNDDEKKRREREMYEAFFAKERQKEQASTRTAIIWVAVVGGGMTFVFLFLYFIMAFLSALGQ